MSFSDNKNLLNDPNIMIADTGVTCSSIACHALMINMNSTCAEDKIIASKGGETRPTKIVDLSVTQYDKNRQKFQRLVIQSVTVTPHGSYKLFSVTKRMKEGW